MKKISFIGRIMRCVFKNLAIQTIQISLKGKSITKEIIIDYNNNKIILIQPHDIFLYLSALRDKGNFGYIKIISHANSNQISGINSACILVNILKASNIWSSGVPILIDACKAGGHPIHHKKMNIAQEIAIIAKTSVTAATLQTWSYPTGNTIGNGTYASLMGIIPNIFRPGQWITYDENGSVVNQSMAIPLIIDSVR